MENLFGKNSTSQKVDNVNLFLHALGLDSSQIVLPGQS